MKKKILILAAVAVSGLAAAVASNTNNKVFETSDAYADCELSGGSYTLWCSGSGQCAKKKFGHEFKCDSKEMSSSGF